MEKYVWGVGRMSNSQEIASLKDYTVNNISETSQSQANSCNLDSIMDYYKDRDSGE